MRFPFLTAMVLLCASPAFAEDVKDEASLPHWMAGAWDSSDGENWADEYWTPARGGMMIGAARMGKGDALIIWESTRIMRGADGTLSFFAQPRGVPASEFPMVASSPTMIEFANPAHDYPQRIRYWRDGALLKARISLMDGTQAYEYRFHAMGSGAK